MSDPLAPKPVSAALGRVPSGLFILTARRQDRSTGMLASWVQQAGFEPPMLTVAVSRDRPIASWIAETGRFALNQLAAQDRTLLKHFAKGVPPDEPAFEGLELLNDDRARGGPVLARALAFLDLEVAGTLEPDGDHRILLGRVVGGELLHPDRPPMLHVRRDGLHY